VEGGLVAMACAAGLLAAGSMVGASVPQAAESDVVAALSDAALAEVGAVDGEVLVSDRFGPGGPMWSRGLVLQLERHGVDVKVAPGLWFYFTPPRVAGDGVPAARLLLVEGDGAIDEALADPDLRLLVRLPGEPPHPEQVGWNRAAQALGERFAAGELTYEEYGDALRALPDPPPQPYGGAQVSLFVDQRPGR
jgi:hypothetical protein